MNKFFIFSVLFLTITSCVITESRMYPRQYSLKNESSQNIKLKYYFKFDDKLVYGKVITLNKTEIFSSGILETDQPHSNDLNYPINAFKYSDSLIIIYDNSRKSTFFINFDGSLSSPIKRNPFRHGNYLEIDNDNFQFTITEEDYNNAEHCNGNCD